MPHKRNSLHGIARERDDRPSFLRGARPTQRAAGARDLRSGLLRARTRLPADEPPGHTEFAKAFYAAFPDLKHTIDETFATEEKAAVRFTITGTHQGELIGIPATGKPIEISGIAIFHIVGGKIEQLYPIFDQMGMMK